MTKRKKLKLDRETLGQIVGGARVRNPVAESDESMCLSMCFTACNGCPLTPGCCEY